MTRKKPAFRSGQGSATDDQWTPYVQSSDLPNKVSRTLANEHLHPVYASDVLGQRVVLRDGRSLGTVDDILCRTAVSEAPLVTSIVVHSSHGDRFLPLKAVESVGPTGDLTITDFGGMFQPLLQRTYLSVRHELLDHQVIDLPRGTVPRVNDILFVQSDRHEWTAHGALIGRSGLIRRILPRSTRTRRVLPHEHLPDLERLSQLYPGGAADVTTTRLGELSPESAARILAEIPVRQALALMTPLSSENLASVMRCVEPVRRRTLLMMCDAVKREGILRAMPSGLAAVIYRELARPNQATLE